MEGDHYLEQLEEEEEEEGDPHQEGVGGHPVEGQGSGSFLL